MTAQRRSRLLTELFKLARRPRRQSSMAGPGCTCFSCVQAWDRHHPNAASGGLEARRLRPGLY